MKYEKICVNAVLGRGRVAAGVCARCDRSAPARTEAVFGDMIVAAVGFEPTSRDAAVAADKACAGLSRRRPDLLYDFGTFAVVVEIDEHSHALGYDPSCELAKVCDQNEAIRISKGDPDFAVFTIRVNPDAYDRAVVRRSDRAARVAECIIRIKNAVAANNGARWSNLPCPEIYYLYYHSAAAFQIAAARRRFSIFSMEE
jgi:hypothetical protein